MKNPVQMAVIGAAHGIKGEVRVKSFTADPAALGDYGPLQTADGRRFEVIDIRPAGTVVVVRFKGVSDRTAAEALNGTALFIDRSALPDDGEEDEFYHTDLIGLEVRDETGTSIGTVKSVQNFGGGDILEVKGSGGDLLIPFTRAAVPHLDIAGGLVTIDRIAAGLVDDDDDAEQAVAGPRDPQRRSGGTGGDR